MRGSGRSKEERFSRCADDEKEEVPVETGEKLRARRRDGLDRSED